MRKIVRSYFPGASRVIDRFHVQKLAYDALQEMRIAHRWDAINEETKMAIRKNNYLPEAAIGLFWFLGSFFMGWLYEVSLGLLIGFSMLAQLMAIPFFVKLKFHRA